MQMNCQSFLQNTEGYTPVQLQLLPKICEAVEEFDDVVELATEKNMLSLFSVTKAPSLSKAQFYNIKAIILRLYQWLADRGEINPAMITQILMPINYETAVAELEIDACYFKNLKFVIEKIEQAGAFGKVDLSGERDLLMVKSIAILAWNGLNPDQMREIKKIDLHDDDKSVTTQIGKVFCGDFYKYLRWQADIDEHRGYPSGKVQRYKASPYLFRSHMNVQSTRDNITSAINRLNVGLDDRGMKRINIATLKKNGQMYRVMELDKNDGNTIKVCGE